MDSTIPNGKSPNGDYPGTAQIAEELLDIQPLHHSKGNAEKDKHKQDNNLLDTPLEPLREEPVRSGSEHRQQDGIQRDKGNRINSAGFLFLTCLRPIGAGR